MLEHGEDSFDIILWTYLFPWVCCRLRVAQTFFSGLRLLSMMLPLGVELLVILLHALQPPQDEWLRLFCWPWLLGCQSDFSAFGLCTKFASIISPARNTFRSLLLCTAFPFSGIPFLLTLSRVPF
jgi:hypothetical protein